MQHTHEDHTPPPPYTLVDQIGNRNNNHAHENDTATQYHSQNPYPATVISGDGDYRLAQKLQDEEYALWVDQNQQEQHLRAGESSTTAPPPQRAPISPSIPEHYPRNSYQNAYPTQQHPILYASPNQPPLPYTHIAPYATNVGGSDGGRPYYGSLSQGAYYSPPQSHPFYNAPYYNYQQAQQDQHLNYRDEEDSSQGCLTGLALASIMCYVCSMCELTE